MVRTTRQKKSKEIEDIQHKVEKKESINNSRRGAIQQKKNEVETTTKKLEERKKDLVCEDSKRQITCNVNTPIIYRKS